ncbi:pseudouridine synthase [Clostridium manihotivorum]|uniref:Pseudouridine synthase n=1 Tax=Clostridium manihotivorum TaxID=2320868 RepID=A0A410DZD6_9CLOT|nr:pseudouridine synthase [Clostridium manihotivorum]QAA34423.1 23S rRNA pseudouridine synthase F [Clostridium manihotivorum]
MRINKLLSNLGICSRREANRIIEEGRITVNGALCIPGQWVELEDEILIDGEPIKEEKKVYILLNKPAGVTCTAAKDVEDNIIDFIDYQQYIFPVGRLDKESEGLILLTNDGELANSILEADNSHEKEYVVTVDRSFDDKFIEDMSKGVDIGGVITRECKVERINEDTFSIILTQGLNRQIRKMSKACGYSVVKLIRIRILNLFIDNLVIGEWRDITEGELEELRKLL